MICGISFYKALYGFASGWSKVFERSSANRAYFTIHPEMYKESRIKPLPTDRDFLKEADWLEEFTKALRKRGMKPSAEISHTVISNLHKTVRFYLNLSSFYVEFLLHRVGNPRTLHRLTPSNSRHLPNIIP